LGSSARRGKKAFARSASIGAGLGKNGAGGDGEVKLVEGVWADEILCRLGASRTDLSSTSSAVLNEGKISQRAQYMIEVLMQVRKDEFQDNPILPEGLDLVEEDEQITHQIQLDEKIGRSRRFE
jgi:hypothetical protein